MVVWLRQSRWCHVVASPWWAVGAWFRRMCRAGVAGAMWWSGLYGSGLDDPPEGGWFIACRRSGHRGATWMPDKGGAKGGEDLAHEGRMRSSCFFLRVDGGQDLSCRQRRDLVDCKDKEQALCFGAVQSVVGHDDLPLLPAIQVEPPCRQPLPGVLALLLGPPQEAVEGVSWVPGAGLARQDGCEGVSRLAWWQGAAAIQQSHVPGDHGVEGHQVATACQRSCCDPPLVLVAVLQHHPGDGAGGDTPQGLRLCLRPRQLRVLLHHFLKVLPLLSASPAFSGR